MHAAPGIAGQDEVRPRTAVLSDWHRSEPHCSAMQEAAHGEQCLHRALCSAAIRIILTLHVGSHCQHLACDLASSIALHTPQAPSLSSHEAL